MGRIVVDLMNNDFGGDPLKRNLNTAQLSEIADKITQVLEGYDTNIGIKAYIVNDVVPTDELTSTENVILKELIEAENEGGFLYFDVYINDGDNGFSVAVRVHTMEYEGLTCSDEEVIKVATENGIIDKDDVKYIKSVREIDVFEYTKIKLF